jgi:hypothetical protein
MNGVRSVLGRRRRQRKAHDFSLASTLRRSGPLEPGLQLIREIDSRTPHAIPDDIC